MNIRVFFIIALVTLFISILGQWNEADKNERLREEIRVTQNSLIVTQHDLAEAQRELGACTQYPVSQ